MSARRCTTVRTTGYFARTTSFLDRTTGFFACTTCTTVYYNVQQCTTVYNNEGVPVKWDTTLRTFFGDAPLRNVTLCYAT